MNDEIKNLLELIFEQSDIIAADEKYEDENPDMPRRYRKIKAEKYLKTLVAILKDKIRGTE